MPLYIAYASLAGKSSLEARSQFLRNLRNWPLYGATLFLARLPTKAGPQAPVLNNNGTNSADDEFIEPISAVDASDTVWLALSRNGIDILSCTDLVRKYNNYHVNSLHSLG